MPPPLPASSRFHHFRPRLADALAGYSRPQFLADLGAGLTVAVVALPLAMAFAIASGVKPEQGLVTAIVGGLLISALGGTQLQIGGPAGAFIVIVYGIVQRHGVDGLLMATMMAGVLLMLMGWLKLGVLVRYIPVPIVIGFTNGIAVLIGLSQLKDLLGLKVAQMPADFFGQLQVLAREAGGLNPSALLLGSSCLALVVLWPKSYRMPVGAATLPLTWRQRLRRAAAHLPGTLVALVLATLLARLLALPVETIGTRFGGIPQALPGLTWPDISWQAAQQLVLPAVTLALLGAIESLLCARVADNIAPQHSRHDPNQELMAQGVANLASPIFGGIPATGTIARTVTNVRAGAVSPVAGMVHALALMVIVLLAAPLAEHVPLAALAGILLFVAWNMGEWREFVRLKHFLLSYRAVLLGTFVLTVVVDLTVAVEVGLLLACGFFIWRMSQLFRVQQIGPASPVPAPPGVVVCELVGALFFGAVGKVEGLASALPPGTRTLVLDLRRMLSIDSSGIEALQQLHRQLRHQGIALVLVELDTQPLDLVRRSGLADELGPGHLMPTLDQALAGLAASDGAQEGAPPGR